MSTPTPNSGTASPSATSSDAPHSSAQTIIAENINDNMPLVIMGAVVICLLIGVCIIVAKEEGVLNSVQKI